MTKAQHPIHPALARLARAAEHQDFAELEETLHVALRKPTWLRPEHRVGDPTRYMRHILYIDPDGDFVITAITWLPGQVSPVHGHQRLSSTERSRPIPLLLPRSRASSLPFHGRTAEL